MIDTTGLNQINVEEIMAEIRRDIEKKGYKNDDISFSSIPIHSAATAITEAQPEDSLSKLRSLANVAAYRHLKSIRTLGSLIIFIKKIIRKCTKFYIEPIVADQNVYNNMVVSCLQELNTEIQTLKEKIKELEDKNIS